MKAETLEENYQALSELYSNMRKELDCTRKALDVATHRLNQIAEHDCDQGCMYVAQNALAEITALEQKD